MRPPAPRRPLWTGWVPGAVATIAPVRTGRSGDRESPGPGPQPGLTDISVTGGDGTSLVGRGLRTLAGFLVVTWSFRLSGYLTFAPWLAGPIVGLGVGGLGVIVAAW